MFLCASLAAAPVFAEGVAPTYFGSFGVYGTGVSQFREPADLTFDASGDMWVADSQNHRLQEFENFTEPVQTIGSQGTGNGQFEDSVMGVTVDHKGNVWASDTNANRVEEFNSEGVFQRAVGSSGSGNGQFSAPEGMATNPVGFLYVADRGNRRIEEFSSATGEYVGSITSVGETGGPAYVAEDAKTGNLWVTIPSENRIEEFNGKGEKLLSFGTAGCGAGQLNAPENLTVGPEGNIWVAEYGNNRVQVFSQKGEYLFGFGSYGSGPGQFWHAKGIAILGTNVYALDSGDWSKNTGNSRIELWNME